MSDLTEFLLARIAEDEAVARAACIGYEGEPRFKPDWHTSFHAMDEGMVFDADNVVVVYDEGPPGENGAAHIARWDPTRVLAEYAAKKAIVALHDGWHVCVSGNGLGAEDFADLPDDGMRPCPTLRDLAAIYADHADYDEEWRP